MNEEWENMEGSSRGLFDFVTRRLPTGIEEETRNPCQDNQRSEPSTYQKQV
jgi:hypothetical protein